PGSRLRLFLAYFPRKEARLVSRLGTGIASRHIAWVARAHPVSILPARQQKTGATTLSPSARHHPTAILRPAQMTAIDLPATRSPRRSSVCPASDRQSGGESWVFCYASF